MGLGQLNQANLHPAKHEFKRRPTQLNSGPIRARNQKKFAPNPSPIRIRIPVCTSVSIFGISFGSDIQLRWFKLSWRVNLKGYNFFSLPKVRIMTLNGQKSSVNWSLKIWDFLQTEIGFLDLFKGSLRKKERGEKPERKRGCRIEVFFLGVFWKRRIWGQGRELHVDQPVQMKDISFICFLFNFIMN